MNTLFIIGACVVGFIFVHLIFCVTCKTNLKSFEKFQLDGEKWDPYGTTPISGNAWAYDGPTTRVEYKFAKGDTAISPV